MLQWVQCVELTWCQCARCHCNTPSHCCGCWHGWLGWWKCCYHYGFVHSLAVNSWEFGWQVAPGCLFTAVGIAARANGWCCSKCGATACTQATACCLRGFLQGRHVQGPPTLFDRAWHMQQPKAGVCGGCLPTLALPGCLQRACPHGACSACRLLGLPAADCVSLCCSCPCLTGMHGLCAKADSILCIPATWQNQPCRTLCCCVDALVRCLQPASQAVWQSGMHPISGVALPALPVTA